MKKLFNLIILLLISITFSGCYHLIEDDKELIVREKRMSTYSKYKFAYELFNSAALYNIEFYSNRNFEIGDTIRLEVD